MISQRYLSLIRVGLISTSLALFAMARVAEGQVAFVPTGAMSTPRYDHTATLLNSGKVLIVGGNSGSDYLATAELYDPSTGEFTPTGGMLVARSRHTATLLNSGKVLIAGGDGVTGFVADAELYDPATGSFSATGSLLVGRELATATLLQNGQVLITGGNNGQPIAEAEIYDPISGLFSSTGSMSVGRYWHTATLLNDGTVLVAGGRAATTSGGTSTAEIYDPSTGEFTPTGSMAAVRSLQTATLLQNGQVLIAGGQAGFANFSFIGDLASAELYDPISGGFALTGAMNTARDGHSATLLGNGEVLIAGGTTYSSSFLPLDSAEIYSPVSGSFVFAGNMTSSRNGNTATLLNNGEVLLTGGEITTTSLTSLFSAELAILNTASIQAACPPQYLATCPTLDFGFAIVPRGASIDPVATSTRSITVTDDGSSDVVFSSDSFSLAGASDFALDSSPPSGACSATTTLTPTQSCQLYVQFTPSATASESATLSIAGGPSVDLQGIGMNGFYQFNYSEDPGVPQCFDLVEQSENQTDAGCPSPDTRDSPGYVTAEFGCYLSSVAGVLSSFPGSFSDPVTQMLVSYSSLSAETLDVNPPIPFSSQTSSDPERTLYEEPGSGNLDAKPLPFFLESCGVTHPAQDQPSLDLLGACWSATDNEIPNPDTTLASYLADHILAKHDRVILQLCTADENPCSLGGTHYVVVLGPSIGGDWRLFDPGWRAANADPGDSTIWDMMNTRPTYLLSTHEQGFFVPEDVTPWKFWVTGVTTFSVSAPLNHLGLSALSPVELLVTNSSGQRVGNIGPGFDVAEIPGSSYSRDFPIGDDNGHAPPLGDPSGIKTVFISGAGGDIYNVSVTGTGSGDFTLFSSSSDSMGNVQTISTTGVTAPGASATYQLVYSAAPGALIQLDRVATGPLASFSTSSLGFQSQTVGTSSVAQLIILTNPGDPALEINSVSVSGDYVETNTCGGTVAISQSCTISVSFMPKATGTRIGMLTITDDAPGGFQMISLSGMGVASSVSFGGSVQQPLANDGNGHFVATVTITNQGNVTVDSVEIVATTTTLSAASLTSQPAPMTNLAPGASATVTLTFPITSALSTAASAPLKINGTYSARTVSGNWSVTFRSVTLAH